MEGTNGEKSADVACSEMELNISGSEKTESLNAQTQQKLDEMASKMLIICSTLHEVVDLVQKQNQRVDEHASNLKKIVSTIDGTIDHMKDNSSRTDDLHRICNLLLVKLDTIENMLNKTTPTKSGKAFLSPNNNSPAGHYSGSASAEKKDISNIILMISSDEEDVKTKPRQTRKLNGKATPHVKSLSPDVKPTVKSPTPGSNSNRSDKQGATSSKMKEKMLVEDDSMVGRKLSFVPSPNIKLLKVPKLERMVEVAAPSFLPKTGNQAPTFRTNIKDNKSTGHTFSKFIKSNFPLSPKMNLSVDQAHISSYVFHPFNNKEEHLFKVDDFMGTRKQFQTLCPYATLDDKIVLMMALKINWTQKQLDSPSKWALPPAFMNVVKMGHTIEDLVQEFAVDWMPPFEDLKHIYVPIEDCCGLWYLMVASIEEKVLYHFDPYFEDQDVNVRQDSIQNMWQAITQMSQSPVFPASFIADKLNESHWSIADPMGHLGSGFCQHTAVYVLNWMDTDFPIPSSAFVGLDEELIRMKLTMSLLLGDHNELKTKLEDAAAQAWRSKRFA